MNECDEYCCNHGCNQGRNCPVRVARVKARIPAAEPVPVSAWRYWILAVVAVCSLWPLVLWAMLSY